MASKLLLYQTVKKSGRNIPGLLGNQRWHHQKISAMMVAINSCGDKSWP